MRHNKVEVPLHLVWTTYERRPLLKPNIERAVFRCIAQEARRLNCEVLALNGMPDHVHLAVMFPTTVSIAHLVKQVKGVSSSFVRDQLGTEHFFSWHAGYGVFAFPYSHRQKVIDYIRNQKVHHADRTTAATWEETDAPELTS